MGKSATLNKVIKIMKNKYAVAVFLLAICAGIFSLSHNVVAGQDKNESKSAATTAAAKTDAPSEPWSLRCNEPLKEGETPTRGNCEIFQRMVVAETGQRVAEFAIGYPEGKEEARGVVILPLGILLTAGVQMKIDDSEPFTFQIRFCNQGGCYAYLTLNATVMDMLRKGKKASFLFVDSNGKNFQLDMSLSGMTKVLKQIR